MTAWEAAEPLQTITTFSSIGDSIDLAVDLCGGRLPLWRGHANAAWELIPQVYRPARFFGGTTGAFNETALLNEFQGQGATRMQNAPPYDDNVAWLHLAQHYGLPTRLLDWTRNPLVALYFAVADAAEIGSDGCIWALSASKLNLSATGERTLPGADHPLLVNGALDAFTHSLQAKLPAVFALDAFQSDTRMQVQKSAFTMHKNNLDLRQLETPTPILRRFMVPKDRKFHIYSILDLLGISHGALFPDLSGLCTELRDMRFT